MLVFRKRKKIRRPYNLTVQMTFGARKRSGNYKLNMKAVIVALLCALCISLAIGEKCPPSQRKKCQEGMTCCELPSGSPGCCPYANATCCADKVHCCPHDTYCSSGMCQRKDTGETSDLVTLLVEYDNMPKVAKTKLTTVASNTSDVICGDGSKCDDGDTCCPMRHSYGCCPLRHAVCCADMLHCCPAGSVCDEEGYCTGVEVETNSLNEIFAKALNAPMPVNTVCPGGAQQCPTHQTCCPSAYGGYACCPYISGTCCSDGLHCCSHGQRCDPRGYCV